jgi:hypothetical protein
MGVKVGVYRAGTGPFGRSQCQLMVINPLNAKLNPICHLLALLGAHHILHVSRIRVKHGINSDRSIYMVVCNGNCGGVLLNCNGETEPISTYD